MISATLLALLATASPAAEGPPSAGVLLKAAAAAAPSCRTIPVDAQVVRAALFSPDSAECPVANVAGDVIVLRELAGALEAGHLSMRRGVATGKQPQMDFTPALDRLITTRLIVLEAREMRLDSTDEFKADVASYKASRQRSMLQAIAAKDVKPDPAEVERRYRDAVREWKLKSILLEKEADAKAFEAAMKAGGSFDALAKKFVAEKKAKGALKSEFVPPKHMLPEILTAVQQAKPGVPTNPLKISSGWVVLRVDGSRVPPNDQAARAAARAESLERAQLEAVRRFYRGLVKKYATVDVALLKSLDFEANGEKGFEALLQDQRPVVRIQGEQPITVGDLTREVSMKFFHGLKSPIEQKRVNLGKDEAFEKLLGKRVFAKEAAVRKIEARVDYRRDVAEYERAMVFSTFLDRVIRPEVKISEAEAMKYYEAHKAEFTSPQMYKLEGIGFATSPEAQAALDKLKAGTDFSWMRTTAPGQLTAEKRSLVFDGATVSASTLPKEMVKALTGTTAGSYRLYAHRDGEVYVLRVADQVPPASQPYPEAREEIAKRMFNDKLMQGMLDYAAKLRKAQRVDVLITRVSM
jgi:parvulin-like peptidyl-prolyl isomerase